ncbi:MAG TPA: hypothetical protein DCS07_04340 [Bdellovibrionales bacterium]|nr:hypothetical protein [Bdellovibrionales bacterium]
MFALREVNEKEISYQINAQSAAFPSLNLRGGDITEIEKASQKYEDETNFEIPRIRQDVTLGVTSLKIKQTAKLEFQVDYLAVRNPPLVMIRLDEVSSFLRTQRTLRRMMIPNRGQFHEGANTFIIKPSSIPGFEAELASAIRPGKNYRLTIALMDEANAGMPESEDFYVNPNF